MILTINAIPKVDPAAAATTPQIEVRGHQWWWEFRYLDTNVVTANELVIPVGQPMRIRVESDDVIHCFWVPQLARKIDAIPGWSNHIWLQADKPGTYQGRCTEYCGTQHAWMNFLVRALPPDKYTQWLAGQQVTPDEPAAGDGLLGKQLFLSATCVDCHAVRGTAAVANIGPDLTDLASREFLGSGVLKNTPANLRLWLKNPQALKPGCKMPNFNLTDLQVEHVAVWLESLR
ncbi:MAG: cytochrome c oxidase subunit II [Candidatus Zixiibacteriota bacterium]|nr:MAG: cytochrome c oxidase subunit II [candidate division Zixibacteria bacterium]